VSDLPRISQDAIDAIFRILEKMDVELDENPLEYGPRRLNSKTAEVRRMLSEMESIYLQTASWIQKYKAAHRAAETLLNIEKKSLIANDPETRVGRNAMTQDAIASFKLMDQVREVADMAAILEDLDALYQVIRSKRTDLKDIQSRLRDQMKLCQEELALGSRWGSKPPPGSSSPDLDDTPDVDRVTLMQLHELFQGVRVSEQDFGEMIPPEESSSEDDTEGESSEGSTPGQDPLVEDEIEPVEKDIPGGKTKPLPDDLLHQPLDTSPLRGRCAVCKEPQFDTPSGPTCKNGHVGAPTLEEFGGSSEPVPSSALGDLLGSSGSDQVANDFLLAIGEEPKGPRKGSIDIDSLFEDFDL